MNRSLIPLSMIAACLLAGAAVAGHHEGDDKFAKMDTNNDGRVTSSEHAAYADKMFKEVDSNGDGAVSKDEMKAYMDKHHDGRKPDGVHKEMHKEMHKDMKSKDMKSKDSSSSSGN